MKAAAALCVAGTETDVTEVVIAEPSTTVFSKPVQIRSSASVAPRRTRSKDTKPWNWPG